MKLNEGGPGSGHKGRNTVPFDMPHSDYISVGTRKGLLANAEYDEYEVPLSQITKVGQKNYVPSKVTRMMMNRKILPEKPISVLWVRGDGYHVIDGHHRYLAARKLNMTSLPAKVYRKSEKTMPDYFAGKDPESYSQVVRTTRDARNPGLHRESMQSLNHEQFLRLLRAKGAVEKVSHGIYDVAIVIKGDDRGHAIRQMVSHLEDELGLHDNVKVITIGKPRPCVAGWEQTFRVGILKAFEDQFIEACSLLEQGLYEQAKECLEIYDFMGGTETVAGNKKKVAQLVIPDDAEEESDKKNLKASMRVGLPTGGNASIG